MTTPLPGVDFELGNNYAGNIGVQRPDHPDNSLFFWGFEHSNGSLTAAPGSQDDVPWAIWLQGGYGYYVCHIPRLLTRIRCQARCLKHARTVLRERTDVHPYQLEQHHISESVCMEQPRRLLLD